MIIPTTYMLEVGGTGHSFDSCNWAYCSLKSPFLLMADKRALKIIPFKGDSVSSDFKGQTLHQESLFPPSFFPTWCQWVGGSLGNFQAIMLSCSAGHTQSVWIFLLRCRIPLGALGPRAQVLNLRFPQTSLVISHPFLRWRALTIVGGWGRGEPRYPLQTCFFSSLPLSARRRLYFPSSLRLEVT